MPIWTGPEDHLAASRRHLDDAALLLAVPRDDNAVYLAGYVVECALKARLAGRGPSFRSQDFNHDLSRLTLVGLVWSSIILGSEVDLELASTIAADPSIGADHPARRYWPDSWTHWPDSWTHQEAEGVVALAIDVFRRVIVAHLLDEGLPFWRI